MYKSYEVDLPRSKTPEPIFIQDEINNLKKYMKFIQALIKTTPFYPPPHYKSLYSQEELDKQYWNKVAVVFLEKKHNANTTRKGFPIKMYIVLWNTSNLTFYFSFIYFSFGFIFLFLFLLGR